MEGPNPSLLNPPASIHIKETPRSQVSWVLKKLFAPSANVPIPMPNWMWKKLGFDILLEQSAFIPRSFTASNASEAAEGAAQRRRAADRNL
jgi:hypothetical protein